MSDHDYLSTACFHGHHLACRLVCKFCLVMCKCECHKMADPEEREEQ